MRTIIALLLLAGCGRGASSIAQQRTATLERLLERFHAESKFPGAVAGAWLPEPEASAG